MSTPDMNAPDPLSNADPILVAQLEERILARMQTSLRGVVREAAINVLTNRARASEDGPSPRKRPVAGGRCAAVWDHLDKIQANENRIPTLAEMRKIAKKKRWNANNARIEYYNWRQFHGITRNSHHA